MEMLVRTLAGGRPRRCIRLTVDPRRWGGDVGERSIRGWSMLVFYFNKLGWPGSILLSVVLTGLLFLAFRLFNE